MMALIGGQLTIANLATVMAINYCVGSARNWVKIGKAAYQIVFTAGKVTFIAAQYLAKQMERPALPPPEDLIEEDFVLVSGKVRLTALQFAELLEKGQPLPREFELIEVDDAPH